MKNIKKLVMVVVVFALVLSICGCNSKKEKDTLAAIKDKGTLIVGTSADYPPYEFHAMIDGQDTIVGFDMDIANVIAEDLGVELEIKDMDFDGLLAALSTGKVDMVVAGMTPNDERKEAADFSDIYYEATHGVIVKKGNASAITKIEDLNGKAVGVQQGTIQADIAKGSIESPKEIKELPKITDLILMIQNDKVDAAIMELPVAKAYVKNNADLEICSFELEDEEGGSAVAVKKGNEAFVAEINKTLNKLKDENKIDEFFSNAQAIQEEQGE